MLEIRGHEEVRGRGQRKEERGISYDQQEKGFALPCPAKGFKHNPCLSRGDDPLSSACLAVAVVDVVLGEIRVAQARKRPLERSGADISHPWSSVPRIRNSL